MSHAAVLLAGGKSSRMGRDKAALPVDGEPLWQRQLSVLRATNPSEIFVSGRRDGPYAASGVEVIEDEIPERGPLGGIASALRRSKSDWLLVLAVDMPAMTSEFLAALLEESRRSGTGIVPSVPRLEPLAAVYPSAALAVADECLGHGDRKMEVFVRKLEDRQLVSIRSFPREDGALFSNWNTPDDIP